jgi:hypothetical protein
MRVPLILKVLKHSVTDRFKTGCAFLVTNVVLSENIMWCVHFCLHTFKIVCVTFVR